MIYWFVGTQRPADDEGDGIFWRVNNERFHQMFRDQAIVQAISSKIDRVSPAPLLISYGWSHFLG